MQFLTFFLIILLLLTGLLGGGFGIREFKLPKATAGVRIAAILAALILWLSGVIFQQSRRANFSLTNNLTRGATREQIVLTIEGEKVGSLASSSGNPSSVGKFTVPKAGMYSYSIELSGFYNNNGQEAPFYGQGNGTIDVEPGDVFEVQADFSNNQLTLSLMEK